MNQVPYASKPENTVAMVHQKGYTLNGRLLREAKVGVYVKPN
jgi:molecular chaperone GrpE (heat shock protein)